MSSVAGPEMWRARNRRARHLDDVPLALVVVSGYLFMGVPVGHVTLRMMCAKPRTMALTAFREAHASTHFVGFVEVGSRDQAGACACPSAPMSISPWPLRLTYRNTLALSYTTR